MSVTDILKESSEIFKGKKKIFPFQAAIIAYNWAKEGNAIIKDMEGEDLVVYGVSKSNKKEAAWKWFEDDYILMHDLSSSDFFKLLKEPKGVVIKPLRETATASVGNTPGMGSITFSGDPGTQYDFADQEPGSGDTSDDEEDKIYSEVPEKPISIFQTFENFIKNNQ